MKRYFTTKLGGAQMTLVGLGHVLGNKKMIDEGRKRINKSRIESKYLNQTIRGIKK